MDNYANKLKELTGQQADATLAPTTPPTPPMQPSATATTPKTMSKEVMPSGRNPPQQVIEDETPNKDLRNHPNDYGPVRTVVV